MKPTILIIKSHKDDPEVEVISDIHCDTGSIFILPEGLTVEGIQADLDNARVSAENRMVGLLYWKKKYEDLFTGLKKINKTKDQYEDPLGVVYDLIAYDPIKCYFILMNNSGFVRCISEYIIALRWRKL